MKYHIIEIKYHYQFIHNLKYMKAWLLMVLFVHFNQATVYSQRHIEHIKNQKYMPLNKEVDCSNLPGDNLSERICANLSFQKSDSLLALIYDSVLILSQTNSSKHTHQKIVEMQAKWRNFRDSHCEIIYDSYDNCGACHQRAISYLICLKELTNTRIEELKKLKDQLTSN